MNLFDFLWFQVLNNRLLLVQWQSIWTKWLSVSINNSLWTWYNHSWSWNNNSWSWNIDCWWNINCWSKDVGCIICWSVIANVWWLVVADICWLVIIFSCKICRIFILIQVFFWLVLWIWWCWFILLALSSYKLCLNFRILRNILRCFSSKVEIWQIVHFFQ